MPSKGGSMGGWQSVMVAALDTSIKKVNVTVTWMYSVGNAERLGIRRLYSYKF